MRHCTRMNEQLLVAPFRPEVNQLTDMLGGLSGIVEQAPHRNVDRSASARLSDAADARPRKLRMLRKGQESIEEIAEARERLEILSNDVESIERVMERLGYESEVKLTSQVPRIVLGR